MPEQPTYDAAYWKKAYATYRDDELRAERRYLESFTLSRRTEQAQRIKTRRTLVRRERRIRLLIGGRRERTTDHQTSHRS